MFEQRVPHSSYTSQNDHKSKGYPSKTSTSVPDFKKSNFSALIEIHATSSYTHPPQEKGVGKADLHLKKRGLRNEEGALITQPAGRLTASSSLSSLSSSSSRKRWEKVGIHFR